MSNRSLLKMRLHTSKEVASADLRDTSIGYKKLVAPCNYVRGKTLSVALLDCNFQNSKAFRIAGEVLKSARFNLANKLKQEGKEMDDSRYVVDIHATRGGKSFTKYMPRAKGSAGRITKEKSHVKVILKEIVNG